MLDKEPLFFPSRNRYYYNPAVPDRQLWAIGMVVVQWGMTESIIEQQIANIIGQDEALKTEYKKIRNFKQTVDFFQSLLENNLSGEDRDKAFHLINRIRNLGDKRDKVIHKLWGGGMQEGTWSNPEDYPTTDAAILRDRDEPYRGKSQDARNTLSWRLTFNEIRKIAKEVSILNRDLFLVFFLPPAG
jgi:hypothetical protein